MTNICVFIVVVFLWPMELSCSAPSKPVKMFFLDFEHQDGKSKKDYVGNTLTRKDPPEIIVQKNRPVKQEKRPYQEKIENLCKSELKSHVPQTMRHQQGFRPQGFRFVPLITAVDIADEDKTIKPDGGPDGSCKSKNHRVFRYEGGPPSKEIRKQGTKNFSPAITLQPFFDFYLHSRIISGKGITIAGMFG